MLTPERERELAIHVALSVAADVGLDYIEVIDALRAVSARRFHLDNDNPNPEA